MEKEILGYNILVKVENDICDHEVTQYTKFGYLCTEETAVNRRQSVLNEIVMSFRDFAMSKEGHSIGLPFSSKDESFLNEFTQEFLRELDRKLDTVYIKGSIEQLKKGAKFVSNVYDFDEVIGHGHKEKVVKFKYETMIIPLREKSTGSNWIPKSY